MKGEVNGFQRTLKQSQEDGENLISILNKLENEQEYIKRQLGLILEQRYKVSESYALLMKSLGQTEKELNLFSQVLHC
jgi:septal ring factor EnvC (AmiA/AmiB activator)